jgi:hypothetical protein
MYDGCEGCCYRVIAAHALEKTAHLGWQSFMLV